MVKHGPFKGERIVGVVVERIGGVSQTILIRI
jgi:hypothetical protein